MKKRRTDKAAIKQLRAALMAIKDYTSCHVDASGRDVDQEPDCFCVRCIAVRALKGTGRK